jgi:hypothetical protein
MNSKKGSSCKAHAKVLRPGLTLPRRFYYLEDPKLGQKLQEQSAGQIASHRMRMGEGWISEGFPASSLI